MRKFSIYVAAAVMIIVQQKQILDVIKEFLFLNGMHLWIKSCLKVNSVELKATVAQKQIAQRKEDEEKKRKILKHQFQIAECSSEAKSIYS